MSNYGVDLNPMPFCCCFKSASPDIPYCTCAENVANMEWSWAVPNTFRRLVELTRNDAEVNFETFSSGGLALVGGKTTFTRDYIYYFELKMMTEPVGVISIGVGAKKPDDIFQRNVDNEWYLGQDNMSYGLSYQGILAHDGIQLFDQLGYGRGTLVGVKVDMWAGTLEYYINRRGTGITYNNLRKHQNLYPIISATDSDAKLRLIYASKWKASLLASAAKILADTMELNDYYDLLSPQLKSILKKYFFLRLSHRDEEGEMAKLRNWPMSRRSVQPISRRFVQPMVLLEQAAGPVQPNPSPIYPYAYMVMVIERRTYWSDWPENVVDNNDA